ncbi:hypothetical protein V2J09_001756 [Rumex salicifolius]
MMIYLVSNAQAKARLPPYSSPRLPQRRRRRKKRIRNKKNKKSSSSSSSRESRIAGGVQFGFSPVSQLMGDRVYPRDNDSPPYSGEHGKQSSGRGGGGMHRHTLSQESLMSKDSYATYSGPPSGTYVIQVPKDKIYRIPPPENAHKYKLYTTRQHRRGGCRRCCCTTLGLLILLVCLLAAAVGIFFLIYQPKAPSFSVTRVSVNGMNITSKNSASVMISPVLNVTVRAENPNSKIGIYYEPGSSVTVYHDGVKLCGGSLPVFYQASRNVTVFSTELDGGDIVLSSSARAKLASEQEKGNVPLKMEVEVPARVRVGSLKTWKLTAKVECTVALSALSPKAKVVSKKCSAKVIPW